MYEEKESFIVAVGNMDARISGCVIGFLDCDDEEVARFFDQASGEVTGCGAIVVVEFDHAVGLERSDQ